MNKLQTEELQVPPDKKQRDELRCFVRNYCARCQIVPPLTLTEVSDFAEDILRRSATDKKYRGYVCVLVGNESWRHVYAATPQNRRILLLPQCMRSSEHCRADSDAVGLLCEACGQCDLGDIQREAEDLGYAIVIAEGTTTVAALLAQGGADAVLGVSCLDALQRSFEPMNSHAIPGMAVPLLYDGCKDTATDLDLVRELLYLSSDAKPLPRLNFNKLQQEVAAWFEHDNLRQTLSFTDSTTEQIALEWLTRDGKRWRPLLCVAVYQALSDRGSGIPDTIKNLAIAVECFHKASLVHDDIEDDDDTRYGHPTLHRQHGVATAINIGDLLIGAGYHLIATAKVPAAQLRALLQVAGNSHCLLCRGQGEELLLRQPDAKPPTPEEVLEIFKLKTAPAFDVALQFGAICGKANKKIRKTLSDFTTALGIAYQIRDDLADLHGDHTATENGIRPSLVLAHAHVTLKDKKVSQSDNYYDIIKQTDAEKIVNDQLAHFHDLALSSLKTLEHVALKSLLFRLTTKIMEQRQVK